MVAVYGSYFVNIVTNLVSLYYQTGILYVSGIDENATIAIYDLTGKLVKVTLSLCGLFLL